jgi:hypothetical protein
LFCEDVRHRAYRQIPRYGSLLAQGRGKAHLLIIKPLTCSSGYGFGALTDLPDGQIS